MNVNRSGWVNDLVELFVQCIGVDLNPQRQVV